MLQYFKWAQRGMMEAVDLYYGLRPQPIPDQAALDRCKIVSHRGEHDNRRVLENTFAAFDPLIEHRVWGLECDVRWTKDLVPVVFHDADLQRLMGRKQRLQEITAAQLRKDFPEIPFLEELLQRYEAKVHYMVELKEEFYPRPDYQSQVLESLFAGLQPKQDFHFISLRPELFKHVNFVPGDALLNVAEANAAEMSEHALVEALGGVTGHFLLLNQQMHLNHIQRGQSLGTGFIKSKACLFRELNRDVEWIFSNHALKLQKIINQASSCD
ncbi:MAG: glycerophosphodiester phosphodiesterase [Gammaproteobacteria bacterium]|nr:glycerophosphodiester phosphodiesterase [Gammaproteobacteria bacterium]